MDAAQKAFTQHLAIMVYNYLLEWRLEDVAQLFAASCPILANQGRVQDHGLLSIIPYRRLHDAMWEYTELLDSMRRTIQSLHTSLPIPFGATSWDKIKFILDFLYVRAKPAAGDDERTDANPNSPAQPVAGPSSAASSVVDVRAENDYHFVQVDQPAALPNASLAAEEQQQQQLAANPATDNAAVQSTTGTRVMMYLGAEAQQQLSDTIENHQLNTIFITMNGSNQQLQLRNAVQTNPAISYIALTEHGEPIEFNALPVEPVEQADQHATESALIDLRSISSSVEVEKPTIQPALHELDSSVEIVNAEPEPTTDASMLPSLPMLEMDASMQSGLTPPQPLLAEEQNQQPEPEPTPMLVSVSATCDSSPIIDEAVARPASTKKRDDKAMAEWSRIRGVNLANLDNHIRMLNYQAELKAVKAAKALITGTGRGGRKKQVAKASGKTPQTRLAAAATEQKASTLGDSDTSDFASSPNEDADVRQMFENVKQYRKQKKLAAKENQGQESPAQSASSSSVLSMPSALTPVCRMNLVAGRSPQKVTSGRSLRKRTLSGTSPANTPRKRTAKRSPTVPSSELADVPAAHTTPSTPNRRTGVGKLPKKSLPPELAQSAAKTHRPVRACALNRKHALKQPNRKHGPAEPGAAKEGTSKAEPQQDNPTAGAQDEAAIDAVLAKLHGEY